MTEINKTGCFIWIWKQYATQIRQCCVPPWDLHNSINTGLFSICTVSMGCSRTKPFCCDERLRTVGKPGIQRQLWRQRQTDKMVTLLWNGVKNLINFKCEWVQHASKIQTSAVVQISQGESGWCWVFFPNTSLSMLQSLQQKIDYSLQSLNWRMGSLPGKISLIVGLWAEKIDINLKPKAWSRVRRL